MKTYLRHKIQNVVDIKGLVALEYLDFEGKYRDYVESHDFWELCYVQKGEVNLVLDGKSIALRENSVFIIPPDRVHSYVSHRGNQSRVFVVCFESFSTALKTVGEMCVSADETVTDCIGKIIDEYKNTYRTDSDVLKVLDFPNFGGQQVIILQLEYLIICMLRTLSATKNPEVVFIKKEDFYSELTDVIIGYFRENIRTKISLQDVCKKVNYSRSFLCKTFKMQTGESLFSYFNKLKIEEAKKMLDDGKMTVTAISRELGFSDVKYFGATFRKVEGISPTAYRKNKE